MGFPHQPGFVGRSSPFQQLGFQRVPFRFLSDSTMWPTTTPSSGVKLSSEVTLLATELNVLSASELLLLSSL